MVGGWDGFDGRDAARGDLPEAISFEDFERCTPCYINDPAVVFDTAALHARALRARDQAGDGDRRRCCESRPYLTRLYTTMSADEMTMDPVFEFNPDLPDVSNVHTANRYVRCDGDPTWRAGAAGRREPCRATRPARGRSRSSRSPLR